MTGPRTAIVTGATGYLGGALAARLVADGWATHAIVRPSSDQSLLPAGVIPYAWAGDPAALGEWVASVAPDVVFHLASNVTNDHRAADVAPLIEANVTFPTHLVEAMSAAGVTAFVNTGTSWQHFEGRLDPVNLYAATKQAFEAMLAFYVSVRSMRAVTLKLFDTYGPRDRRRKIFPLLREAARTGTTLRMSEGRQLIDLVYVDDVVEAFVLAAERLARGNVTGHEEYAVSSGERLPLRDLVDRYAALLDVPPTVEWGGRPYRAREVMTPWSDGRPLPGWAPRVGLDEGLRRMEADRHAEGSRGR